MSVLKALTAEKIAALCDTDGEFHLAARGWTGGFKFVGDEDSVSLVVNDGHVHAGDPGDGDEIVVIKGADTLWAELLAAVPARFRNDLWPLVGDRKSTRLNSSHLTQSRMPSSA